MPPPQLPADTPIPLLAEPCEVAGAEPDQCYIVGEDLSKDRPDLAIEVVWTSGGIDKLEVYRQLGIAEVWFWRDERITVHILRGERYEAVLRSSALPGLDTALLASFLDRPFLSIAKRDYRSALHAR